MTDQMRHLRVYGLPKPQGSKTVMPNGALIAAGSKQSRADFATWRNAIATTAANHALNFGWLDAPAVRISCVFRFPMPASRPASVKRAGIGWKPSAPDADKLIRAVGDALQGTLLANDARIVEWHCRKIEVFDQWTGLDLWLWPAADSDLESLA